MAIRLWAAVLAFVVTGAPVATITCEAACVAGEMAGTPSGAHEHHSCHTAAPSDVALNGPGHACGHSDGGDWLGTEQAAKTFVSPAVVVASASIEPPILQPQRFAPTCLQHSPPGALSLTTQLRI